jgi:Zn-dependent protease
LAGIDFGQVFFVFLVVLASLTVHEAAHAWSADRLGDSTARLLGRVSLNPAVHIDPIGTVLFPLIALISGLPVLGWAKPVPVNTRNLGATWKEKFMAIAAAGPASNVVLATLAAIGLRVMNAGDPDGFAQGVLPSVLEMAVRINILLAVFNMIPVPPLDGGNVLSGLLRGRAAEAFDSLRPYGFLILYALLFTGILSSLVSPPAAWLIGALL